MYGFIYKTTMHKTEEFNWEWNGKPYPIDFLARCLKVHYFGSLDWSGFSSLTDHRSWHLMSSVTYIKIMMIDTLILPIDRWGNWDTQRLSDLVKVAWSKPGPKLTFFPTWVQKTRAWKKVTWGKKEDPGVKGLEGQEEVGMAQPIVGAC
jgi:hypothetical protein